MCGYIGSKQAAPVILNGLERLEYRGYDSAGMAVYDNGAINVVKAKGKLRVLEELTHGGDTVTGTLGIGHTRWAPHGKPNEVNAHPHCNADKSIAVVHNGIIENFAKLKERLIKNGYEFISDTDTEVVANLLDHYYKGDPLEALTKVLHRIEGSYALGVIFSDKPDKLYAARKGSPLIVGIGKGENYIASDVPAILKYTRSVVYLDDREIACLSADEAKFYTVDEEELEKLRILTSTDDGFKIAEEDLKRRGPGTIAGTRQSGLPDFRFVNVIDDFRMFEFARDDATYILNNPKEKGFAYLISEARKKAEGVTLA